MEAQKIISRKAVIASVIALVCLAFNCPVQAVLLHGYLERESGQEVAPVDTDGQAHSHVLAKAAAVLNQSLAYQASANQTSANQRSGNQAEANPPHLNPLNVIDQKITNAAAAKRSLQVDLNAKPPANSFPYSYIGTWRCVSEVIDSQVDSIEQGKQIVSDIVFAVHPDGRVVAQWNQPGWSQTNAQVTTFNSQEAKLVRTNYYADAGADGFWAARSSDQFKQIADDQMVAQSYVDQYVAGDYKGRYHTKSMLFRLAKDNARGIAFSTK